MISLGRNFLFIHYPKTGGNSIQQVLKKYSEENIVCLRPHQDGVERFEVRSDSYKIRKHASLEEYHQQLGASVINGLFRFCCVRNPWDRLVSFYFSPHAGKSSWDRESFIALLEKVHPLTDYLSLNRADSGNVQCFRNIDYFIRFEQIEQDFTKVCGAIGLPSPRLKKYNVSKHYHYSYYYDDELIELVGQRFRMEAEFFGYCFDRKPDA